MAYLHFICCIGLPCHFLALNSKEILFYCKAIINSKLENALTEREEMVYDMIRGNQKIGIEDIAVKLGVTRRTSFAIYKN